jgi:hypothetical protein
MQFCDTNPNILQWGSEEFKIQYYHPIKHKICNYLHDFIIKYRDSKGEVHTEVIEIKPKKQSVVGKRMSTYDQVQLVINQAKWTAAVAVCNSYNIKFRVLTECELFRK